MPNIDEQYRFEEQQARRKATRARQIRLVYRLVFILLLLLLCFTLFKAFGQL